MMADHLVDLVKPPEGELDRPAEEPDDTHYILIDEVDPIPCFEDFDTLLVDSSSFPLIRSSSLFIISFRSISPFFISKPKYL